MTLLLNTEAHGTGRANPFGYAHSVLRSLLPEATEVELETAQDFTPVEGIKALPTIIENTRRLRAHIHEEPVYSLGGDCGSELAPVAVLNERYAGNLQVVWFDAHADLNTPATSPSANFHGMVLRTLCGDTVPSLKELVPVPVRISNVYLCGQRSVDPDERTYLQAQGLTIYQPHHLPDAVPTGAPVYLHVDYDVLDSSAYPESFYPTPNGPSLDDIIDAVAALRKRCHVVGYSLTEYTPKTPDAGIEHVRRLLQQGFGLTL